MKHSPHHHVNLADLDQLIKCPQPDEEPVYSRYYSEFNHPKRYILISGNYDDNAKTDNICLELGYALSGLNVGIISGSGKAGTVVSNALSEKLCIEHRLDPERIIFYMRGKKRATETLLPSTGTVKFYGNTPHEMREKMVSKVKAVISIAGHEGTKEEAALAIKHNVPVIPLACSGASAYEIWQQLKPYNYSQSSSVQHFETKTFDELADEDFCVAVNATIKLLKSVPDLL